jgi:hypothetical protein
MNGWKYYGTPTLQVVPYMPGSPVYRDGTLSHLYFSLKEEGKIADTFCGEQKNLDQFISYFDRLKTLQVLCRVRENETLQPVGFSWVDMPRGVDGARACQCGEAFFGDVTKTSDARNLARLALAYAFEDLQIDVLHGIQLESNFAARNFSVRLGFKEVAIVPKWHYVDGGLQAARVMMLEKKDFMPGFQKWHDSEKPVAVPA